MKIQNIEQFYKGQTGVIKAALMCDTNYHAGYMAYV